MADIPPHLSGCPRHGGLPVPKVVKKRGGCAYLQSTHQWGAMGATHKTMWRPEGDIPDFAKYDDELLRRCIEEKWCHVCGGKPMPLLICLPQHVVPEDGQQIEVGGRMVPLVLQPWVCAPCLAYAVEHCPPLKEGVAAGRGLVAFPLEYQKVATFWQPVNGDDPPLPSSSARVVSIIKLALVRAAYQSLPSWAAKVRKG